jgi:hypothetical protein
MRAPFESNCGERKRRAKGCTGVIPVRPVYARAALLSEHNRRYWPHNVPDPSLDIVTRRTLKISRKFEFDAGEARHELWLNWVPQPNRI